MLAGFPNLSSENQTLTLFSCKHFLFVFLVCPPFTVVKTKNFLLSPACDAVRLERFDT